MTSALSVFVSVMLGLAVMISPAFAAVEAVRVDKPVAVEGSTEQPETLSTVENYELPEFDYDIGFNRAEAIWVIPQIGEMTFDSNVPFRDDTYKGIALGYNFTEHWSIEGLLGQTSIEGNDNEDLVTIGVSGLYTWFPSSRIYPVTGLGIGQFSFPGGTTGSNYSTLGIAKVGAVGHVSETVAIAGTYRYIRDFDNQANTQLFTLGLKISLGGEAPPPRKIFYDSDGDGVADENDECPETPAGVEVDERGCEKFTKECPDNLDEFDGCVVEKQLKERVVLEGVHFAFGRADLLPEATILIDEFVQRVGSTSGIEFEIEGHTDSVGSDEYNQNLSTQRAEAVAAYLRTKGIDNVKANGFGESRPIASNQTEKGRARNRRAVIMAWTYRVVEENNCKAALEGMEAQEILQRCTGLRQKYTGDDDADKIKNIFDRCPGTKSGTPVDEFGCPLPQPQAEPDADADGDGVADRMDECPSTGFNITVDANGCAQQIQLDSDRDGVSDVQDICPNTILGRVVNQLGCAFGSGAGVVLQNNIVIGFNPRSDALSQEAEAILASLASEYLQAGYTRIDVESTIKAVDVLDEQLVEIEIAERRAEKIQAILAANGVRANEIQIILANQSETESDSSLKMQESEELLRFGIDEVRVTIWK